MLATAWTMERWKDLFEIAGTLTAITFTGIALHIDARVRRAATIIEITKQHRELWIYFYDRPKLADLLKNDRDLSRQPLTDEEVHFVNFLLNHLRATFYARIAGIFVQPECLKEDIKAFFSHPATRAAWAIQKRNHEPKFVAFVEGSLATVV